MAFDYDVIWIGTGQATMTVVPRLAAAGKRVAVIEGGAFGGTCVNFGCTPTKTLVASAHAVHMSRRGAEFGFSATGVEVDFARVMKPQIDNRLSTSGWIENALTKLDGCTVYKGYGRFVDDHTVDVAGQKLRAETVVLHTGTRPRTPDVAGLDSVDWLTNETILDLAELPEHVIVSGGGYIALEFAQLFRRLGSRVTVVTRGPRVLSKEDLDIAELVGQALSREGVEFLHNRRIERLSPDGGVTATLRGEAGDERLAGSHILFAIGRAPNTDRLGLEAAGLEPDGAGYLSVDRVTRTNVPHIYAVGDINGHGGFTHTSVHDGEVFWDHYSREHGLSATEAALDRGIGDRSFVASMFIDPPLARVGMNETEARDSGGSVLMATMPMKSIARAREKRETTGMAKVLVDAATDRFLGATVFGTGGDEVIGAFALAMRAGVPSAVFRRTVFPHPTVSELMPWCLDGLRPLA